MPLHANDSTIKEIADSNVYKFHMEDRLSGTMFTVDEEYHLQLHIDLADAILQRNNVDVDLEESSARGTLAQMYRGLANKVSYCTDLRTVLTLVREWFSREEAARLATKTMELPLSDPLFS